MNGLFGGGQVSGIFKLFRLRFPTYVFADLPEDYGIISNHLGDQPYFGIWNFWANEVEIYCQAGHFKTKKPYLEKRIIKNLLHQKLRVNIQHWIKKGSRLSRFAIISDALHWTHIERPENVAKACLDFIEDNNS